MFDAVKNIAAILGVLVTIATLWKLLTGRLRLTAEAKRSDNIFPPDVQSELDDLRVFFVELFAEQELKQRLNVPERMPENILEKLRSKVPKTSIGGFEEATLFRYTTVYSINIYNAGRREVKNLSFHAPFDEGVYKVDASGKEENGHFKRQLQLGALRTRGTIKLIVWCWLPPKALNDESLYLTHEDGSVPVQLSTEISGAEARFWKFLKKWWIFVAVFFLWTVIGLGNIFQYELEAHGIMRSRHLSTTTQASR